MSHSLTLMVLGAIGTLCVAMGALTSIFRRALVCAHCEEAVTEACAENPLLARLHDWWSKAA